MKKTKFCSLSLSKQEVENLNQLGFIEMTPVQAQSLPSIIKGRDVIAKAQTGTGKTVAFGLGVIHAVSPKANHIQALIICPTRELAEQVATVMRQLARAKPNIKLLLLCGGKPLGPQRNSLSHGAHIIVGTPGRIQDHLTKKSLIIEKLSILVLDEADRMLDMGFVDSMENIINHSPKSRQTLLFSATYPDKIREISRRFQVEPVVVDVEKKTHNSFINQLFYEVKKHQRNSTLLALFEHYQVNSAIVFCYTQKQCDAVHDLLSKNHISALALHGGQEQRLRDQVLVQFANLSCSVLVATDVAARGIDINDLELVINYELPRDPEVYTHRIGRTGRSGKRGLALSLFTESEQVRVNAIASFQKQPAIIDYPESLDRNSEYSLVAKMVTIQIDAGRKNKIRPGDILGALTGDAGLDGTQIGKIHIFDWSSYVAVELGVLRQAMNYLACGKVKGRSIRARRIR